MALILEYVMCYMVAYLLGVFSAIGGLLLLREYNSRHASSRVKAFRRHHVRR